MADTSLKHPWDYKLILWIKKKTETEFILCFYNCDFKMEIGNSIKHMKRI